MSTCKHKVRLRFFQQIRFDAGKTPALLLSGRRWYLRGELHAWCFECGATLQGVRRATARGATTCAIRWVSPQKVKS